MAEGFRTQSGSGDWDGATPLVRNFSLVPIQPIARGTVADESGWVEGARIQAFRSESAEWVWAGDSYAAADGGYELSDELDLGAGTYAFEVSAPGHVPQRHEQAWNGSTPLALDFSLVSLGPLASGSVTSADGGAPIEDAWVLATKYNDVSEEWEWAGFATSGPDGMYAVQDSNERGAGEYRFSVEAEGYLPTTISRTWDGTETLSVDFVLGAPAPLATGSVTQAVGGAVIEGARIEASWFDEAAEEYVLAGVADSGPAGSYIVFDDAGRGPGEYELFVQAAGYISQARTDAWNGTDALSADFALVAQAAVATGTVTEAGSGSAIPDALVSAGWYDADTGLYLWAGDAWSKAGGAYAVYDDFGRGAGEYEFLAEADGYVSKIKHGTWDGTSALAVGFELSPLGADVVAPEIAIGGVANGKTYTSSLQPTFSAIDAVDPYPEVSAELDGFAFGSGDTVGDMGTHVLAVTATDSSGNVATKSVTFYIKQAAQLSFYAPKVSAYRSARVYGWLKDGSGTPLAGKTVEIQYYSRGWRKAATVTTDANGKYLKTMTPSARTSYRAVFAGDATYESKTSAGRAVLPKVRLTRSTSWSTLRRSKTYYAKGYIEPRHYSSNGRVYIRAYKRATQRQVLLQEVVQGLLLVLLEDQDALPGGGQAHLEGDLEARRLSRCRLEKRQDLRQHGLREGEVGRSFRAYLRVRSCPTARAPSLRARWPGSTADTADLRPGTG